MQHMMSTLNYGYGFAHNYKNESQEWITRIIPQYYCTHYDDDDDINIDIDMDIIINTDIDTLIVI